MRGHTKPINCCAFTKDGRAALTAGVDGTVRVWGLDGKLRAKHNLIGSRNEAIQVTSLVQTRDGGEAVFTGVSYGGHAGILDLKSGKIRLKFDKHSNTVTCSALSPDGKLAVTMGGDANEGYVWQRATGEAVQKLAGTGRSVWVVGWTPDGKDIVWGNTNRAEASPVERSFKVAGLEFGPAPEKFLLAAHQTRQWALKRIDFFKIAVLKNGKRVAVFVSPVQDDRVYSFTLLTNDRAAFGTSTGLYLIDLKTGRGMPRLKGHSGIVLTLSPSPDGRLLLSGGSDQIMCVFHPGRSEPLLSLFVAGTEWIAWTPEGYYACSANGERLMSWVINNGPNQLASRYPAIRFHASLFRPDAVRRVLRAGSIQNALVQAARDQNKPAEQTHYVGNVLPPDIAVVSPAAGANLNQAKFQVKATAKSRTAHPVEAMLLLIDGRPWQGRKGIRRFDNPAANAEAVWDVDLPPGRHSLAVLADTKVSRGLSEATEIVSTGADGDLPELYVLAVGVSKYPGKLKLNCAARDAEVIAKTFQEKTTGLYRKVNVRLITDGSATRQNILQGLAWLQASMSARDVAVVSFSGHGAVDPDGIFYLIPVDVSLRDVAGSCVSGEVLKNALANLPGRVLCLLDACHSGSVSEPIVSKARTDNLVRDLVNDEYGVVVMCSSLGSEYSLEVEQLKHGLFTLGIIEGLGGKADLNRDRVVYIHELDFYTSVRVPELSRGKQNPTTGRPPNVRPFPLAKP
jgi:WD40 repeat protein